MIQKSDFVTEKKYNTEVGMRYFENVVSNPPYNAPKHVDQIWKDFVKNSNELAENAILVHPGRWMLNKKTYAKNKKEFMTNMKFFHWYTNSDDIFPGTTIAGGVTVTFSKPFAQDKTMFISDDSKMSEYSDDAVVLSNKFEDEIYKKLFMTIAPERTMRECLIGGYGPHEELGYDAGRSESKLKESPDGMNDPVRIWVNMTGAGKSSRFKWMYLERDEFSNYDSRLFAMRKVKIDSRGHYMNDSTTNIINNDIDILGKDETCVSSFLAFPDKDTNYDLELIQSMFSTKTVRFLMSIHQKDIYVKGFELVPHYTAFKKSLKGELFTDEYFYKEFGFSDELIAYIEKHIGEKKIKRLETA